MKKAPPKRTRAEWMSILRAAAIALATYLVLFALISAAITPERYDIRIGAPAPVTILASEDVEDSVATEQLRDSAAAQVDLSYKSIDPAITGAVLEALDAEFTSLLAIARGEEIERTKPLAEEWLAALEAADDESLAALFASAGQLTRDALVSSLPEGQEGATISRIERDLVAAGGDRALVSIAIAAIHEHLRPNMPIDQATTELNRQQARDAVEPISRVKGEVIVREGEIVSLSQYAMLSTLGLIVDNGIHLILGVALLLLVLLTSSGFYMFRYERDIWRRPQTLILIGIVLILSVGISLLIREVNAYVMPASLGLLLVAVLIRPHLALFFNLVLSILISLLADTSGKLFTMTMFTVLVMTVAGGPLVVSILRRHQQRIAALLAGLLIAATNFLTTLAIGLIDGATLNAVALNALWAALGGLLAAVLCIGLQPLLEWMFNLTTSAKLLELSNPNQPLLRRMLLEAPGSYHHAIIVANLAETAASAIGANGLLARVGAYYHDIGKLKRPMYFKENQLSGDNPHSRTDPRVSAAILAAHTRDGFQMGAKARLPEPVLGIIREHHGDSPMLFFYDKAVKLYGEEVDISAFRYEGPRPRSKEAAVVMLADTIEAAARALPSPDAEKLDKLIRKLVRDKMSDGQLDESELTFADLDRICRAFQSVLSGVFHERIEYPEIEIPPRATPETDRARTVAPETETEGHENDR